MMSCERKYCCFICIPHLKFVSLRSWLQTPVRKIDSLFKPIAVFECARDQYNTHNNNNLSRLKLDCYKFAESISPGGKKTLLTTRSKRVMVREIAMSSIQ